MRALIVVVRPDEDAAVVEIGAAQKERCPVVSAGHAEIVVGGVAGDVRLVGVIVDRCAGRLEIGPPAVAAEWIAHVVARRGIRNAFRIGIDLEWIQTVVSLTVSGLQRIFVIEVIERDLALRGVPRRARLAALGSDEDDALPCTRAVERTGRRAFQDLDVLDVVRVDVRRPVLLRRSLDLARAQAVVWIEVRGRVAAVVDRHAVDDEERLAVPRRETARATYADVGSRAGLTARLGHLDVRRLPRKPFDDVRLVAARDRRRVDVVAHVAELFCRRRRSRSRDRRSRRA